jgi:hypothetical protein
MRTGKGFGFVTFSLTAPVEPGYRSALVEAVASESVSADDEPAFA